MNPQTTAGSLASNWSAQIMVSTVNTGYANSAPDSFREILEHLFVGYFVIMELEAEQCLKLFAKCGIKRFLVLVKHLKSVAESAQ